MLLNPYQNLQRSLKLPKKDNYGTPSTTALALDLTRHLLISQYYFVIIFRMGKRDPWALESSDLLLKFQALLPTRPTILRRIIKLQCIRWVTNLNRSIKSSKTTIFTNLLQSTMKTNLHFSPKTKSFLVLQIVRTWLKLRELPLRTITWVKINPLPNLWIPVVRLGLKKDNSRSQSLKRLLVLGNIKIKPSSKKISKKRKASPAGIKSEISSQRKFLVFQLQANTCHKH